MKIKNFKNKLLLNETLAINIANDIKILLTIKKNIWMVVSGGNTPSDLYKILSLFNGSLIRTLARASLAPALSPLPSQLKIGDELAMFCQLSHILEMDGDTEDR